MVVRAKKTKSTSAAVPTAAAKIPLKRDRLFFAALAAVRHTGNASVEALRKQLGVVPEYAEQLLQDLETEGYVTKPHIDPDGYPKRELAPQVAEETWLTPEGLAREERRSRRVQQALLRRHPAKAGIQQIAQLIEDEIVAVLTAYHRARLLELRDTDRAGSVYNPSSDTMREIGFNVGATIAGVLASEEEWPNGSRELLSQKDQITLFRGEIMEAIQCDDQCNHYYRRSQILHVPDHDLVDRPGWDHLWLRKRLDEIKIMRGTTVGRELFAAIRFVVIRKDGSGVIVTEDGAFKEF